MKKLLVIILLTSVLLSCKKDKQCCGLLIHKHRTFRVVKHIPLTTTYHLIIVTKKDTVDFKVDDVEYWNVDIGFEGCF